jgi:hypothetical protein
MKQATKSNALTTVEMSKTYSLVLYSSGAVMIRRTAFPYNSVSVNAELIPFLDASIRDVAAMMIEDGKALRGAKPAEIKAPIKATQPAKIDDQDYADYMAFKAFKASLKA